MQAVTTKSGVTKCWGCAQVLTPRFLEPSKAYKKRVYCSKECSKHAYRFRKAWRDFKRRKQDLSHWLPNVTM